MAKLPEINPNRQIRQIQSAEAAELPNKNRNIAAAVQTVRQSVKVLDNMFESEAKMDAARRENNAVREYQKRATELTQAYHSDRNMPAEQFMADMEAMRGEAFAGAYDQASGRVTKYLNPRLEDLGARLTANEISAGAKLAQSRQIMHLSDDARKISEFISNSPETMDAQFAQYVDTLHSSTLPIEVQEKMTQDAANQFAQQTINAFHNNDDIDGLTRISQNEIFSHLSPAQQQTVQTTIDSMAADIAVKSLNASRYNAYHSKSSVDDAMASYEAKINGFNGISDAKRTAMLTEGKTEIMTSNINGLIAIGELGKASEMMSNPEYSEFINVDQLPAWGRAVSSGGTGNKVQIGHMMKAMDSDIALMQNGGRPDTSKYMDVDPNQMGLTPAQQVTFERNMFLMQEYDKYSYVLQDIGSKSDDEMGFIDDQLMMIESELRDNPSSTYDLSLEALTSVKNTMDRHREERKSHPAEYARKNDEFTKEAWLDFSSMLQDPNANVTNLQQAWGIYRDSSFRAQQNYNVSGDDLSAIPADMSIFQSSINAIKSGTNAERNAALGRLQIIMGEATQDLVSSLSEKDSPTALTIAFSLLGSQQNVEIMHSGVDRSRIPTAPSKEKFTSSLRTFSKGVEIPFTALDRYADSMMDGMYYYALGIATEDEIATGEFKEETLLAARNEVIGEPVRINDYANPTVTYRKTGDNTMLSPQDVTAQFKQLAIEPEFSEEKYGLPQFRNYVDNSLVPQSWSSVMQYATPVMVGNGKYVLSVPKGSPLYTSGVILDENGEELVIDLTQHEVPNSRAMQALWMTRSLGQMGTGGQYGNESTDATVMDWLGLTMKPEG